MRRKRLVLLTMWTTLLVALAGWSMAVDIDGDGVLEDSRQIVDLDDDGFDDSYVFEARPASSAVDVLIVHDTDPLAYFGWYRASQMPPTGWDLFQRTIDWAEETATRVILFTDDGTLDPGSDSDGLAVYEHLMGAGYEVEVLRQRDLETLEPSYYDGFDLAIYANAFGYDATRVVASGIPFVTLSLRQTDEMGIGTGESTMHRLASQFLVLDNSMYPTLPYPVGPLSFENLMWTDATEASGNGIVLAAATPEPHCVDVHGRGNIVTTGKGQSSTNNATVTHTITGYIIDRNSYGSTAHRIRVCAGTYVYATVSDSSGTPRIQGSLACDGITCQGLVNQKESYQAYSHNGRDKDTITFLPE